MAIRTLAIVALAFGLDLLFGRPPNGVNPLAWFHRLVRIVARGRRGERIDGAVGTAVVVVLPLVPAVVASAAVALAASASPTIAGIVAAVVLFYTTDLRVVLERSGDALSATEETVDCAREALETLSGRDVSNYSPAQIRSAAVEGAATTLSDGLLATLLPFAFLGPISVPVAAGVAAWVAGVRTLDSALAPVNHPAGNASTRLGAIVEWFPTRVAAVCFVVAAGDPGALRRARKWTRNVAPWNVGWEVATLAAVLDVRLERPDSFALNPEGTPPGVETGERAVALIGLAAAIGVLLATLLATVGALLVGPPDPIVLTAD